jgi:2-succinyl-6-hydroxy-2,4-cyclohexadiene-1-carboxylate synthase
LFFLHGFANDSHDWDEVISLLSNNFNWVKLDLPGFGKSDAPEDVSIYSTEFMVELLDDLIKYLTVDKINLIGYSMGGRLALSYAVKYINKLDSLILESTSPGLKTEGEREIRIKSDEVLAEYIQNNSINDFVNYWKNLPLFHSQKNLSEEKKSIIHNRMLELNKIGLIKSLKGFGTGKMNSLWNYLTTLSVPTLLLSGELDEKYNKISNEMNNVLPNSELMILKDAGHNTHLEKPEEFVNLLCSFLQNQKVTTNY